MPRVRMLSYRDGEPGTLEIAAFSFEVELTLLSRRLVCHSSCRFDVNSICECRAIKCRWSFVAAAFEEGIEPLTAVDPRFMRSQNWLVVFSLDHESAMSFPTWLPRKTFPFALDCYGDCGFEKNLVVSPGMAVRHSDVCFSSPKARISDCLTNRRDLIHLHVRAKAALGAGPNDASQRELKMYPSIFCIIAINLYLQSPSKLRR